MKQMTIIFNCNRVTEFYDLVLEKFNYTFHTSPSILLSSRRGINSFAISAILTHLVNDNRVIVLLGMDAGQILAVVAEGDVEAAFFAHFRLEHPLVWDFTRLSG